MGSYFLFYGRLLCSIFYCFEGIFSCVLTLTRLFSSPIPPAGCLYLTLLIQRRKPSCLFTSTATVFLALITTKPPNHTSQSPSRLPRSFSVWSESLKALKMLPLDPDPVLDCVPLKVLHPLSHRKSCFRHCQSPITL